VLAHKRASLRAQMTRRLITRLIDKFEDLVKTRRGRTEGFVEALDRAPSAHPNDVVHVNYSGVICPCTYEMHWVRKTWVKEDLSFFTNLSSASDAIAKANEELNRRERQELYKNWYKHSPRAFMLLKEICHCGECSASGEEAVLVVAASIIIPLSQLGATTISAAGAQAAKSLIAKDHFLRDVESHLLLDTLVARPGYGNYFLQGLQWSLFLQHVHEFVSDFTNRAEPITFWVEPDEPNGNYDLVSQALTDVRSPTANENCFTYWRSLVPSRAAIDLAAVNDFDEARKRLSWKKVISKIDSMRFDVR
jgi:hypothetical protein